MCHPEEGDERRIPLICLQEAARLWVTALTLWHSMFAMLGDTYKKDSQAAEIEMLLCLIIDSREFGAHLSLEWAQQEHTQTNSSILVLTVNARFVCW